jgi:NitT/TauT family transport system substrate-binding protein
MLDMWVEIQFNGFATSRSFIKGQRETVRAALKGYVEAIHYIHQNQEGTKKVMAKYLRNPDPEVLDASYRGFVKMVAKRPYPTLKGIQFLLDEFAAKFPQAKTAKPEQFVDLSLLQELEKEGFFAEVAKRYP